MARIKMAPESINNNKNDSNNNMSQVQATDQRLSIGQALEAFQRSPKKLSTQGVNSNKVGEFISREIS